MDSLWMTGYEKEIERCKKLYVNFSEGAGYIKAVFDALKKYYEKHGNQLSQLELTIPSAEESAEMMRQDESLNLRPDINTALFSELFKLVCLETTKANPVIKETIATVVDKTITFLSEEGEIVSLEKIKAFRDLLIKETAIEKDMATFLFSIVLSSIYRRQLESISKVLRTDLYEGGECPLCGEKPHYGMLRNDDGAKHLECWLCGTSWVHTRVKCPYCSNDDREELGYFTVEGNDMCRVNYCRNCCRYCKIIDARKFGMDGKVILAIHNLASLEYDLLARKEGFFPGSGLEWINEEDEAIDRQD
ncbi:MAG: formate dehydrogenase accessory protein FdhE [Dethiobacteria bacterium]